MNIFSRAKLIFSQTAFQRYVSAFSSGSDLPAFNGAISQETALKYSAFFGCARVLAETFASVPINEFKRANDKGDKDKTDETGLYSMLKFAPNDETSALNFYEALIYQIVLGGNFHAEKLFNGRRIAGLLQIDYKAVEVFRDSTDRRLKYRIKTPEGNEIILDRSQILHIPGPSTNGIVGMSALEYGASAIRLGSTYEQFGQSFYENGAAPSGVFSHPRFLKEEAYNRLVKKIKNDWTGLKKVGKPILAEDGLTFDQITIKPIDAELLSSKQFQIEDICRFLRVPPHLVQHLQKSTFNNIEQQSLEFLMYTMLPYFKRVENNINFQLLTPRQKQAGYFFEFNIASLLRGDQKTMSEAFAKGIQWGWLSINDVRRMLNMNPIEGGDVYLRPLNMLPIGQKPPEKSTKKEAEDKKVNGAINTEIEKIMELAKA